MYTVYALYNKQHNKFYIGQSKDFGERLILHNMEAFPHAYTARFSGEWVVIYTEQVEDRAAALRRERQLKSYRGRQFVKSHIPV